MVSERLFNIESKQPLPNGKSYYSCICPYCNSGIALQVWSSRTTGKRCKCGAVLRLDIKGQGYAKRGVSNA